MDNLRISLSLALIAKRHFACVTNDYEQCVAQIKSLLAAHDDSLSFTEVDILRDHKDLAQRMTQLGNKSVPVLHNLTVWKHLEKFPADIAAKNGMLDMFDELEQCNTANAQDSRGNEPTMFQVRNVVVPDICIIVAIIVAGDSMPKINALVKEWFWFCQSVFFGKERLNEPEKCEWNLSECRALLTKVHFAPDVREYVASLMVFTRSHRLTSLAPLTSRPTLRATEAIVELARALVAWNNRTSHNRLFVTPDYVKVAYRKVCYWLVDWETNATFLSPTKESEHDRRMQISVLTGDWYGSEWPSVKGYLKKYESTFDRKTTSGFRNKLVDDVLESVMPPL
ncbi:hypothetical protein METBISCDRAFT_18984 [Metschnikowia bicuspidata]|uniref:Uncharacterized protein n=1 Tax=Metschnikowia bicuspidata TaxID=27322 RepID=A0A4P9ZB49_9ASCO|nr:hypothetical protein METBISCDRAFT_18984 [Metschnikowia bicuspidata]